MSRRTVAATSSSPPARSHGQLLPVGDFDNGVESPGRSTSPMAGTATTALQRGQFVCWPATLIGTVNCCPQVQNQEMAIKAPGKEMLCTIAEERDTRQFGRHGGGSGTVWFVVTAFMRSPRPR